MEKLAGVPYVARHEGIMAVDDDVLGIVRAIHEISDRLDVYYDETRERLGYAPFVVVERCLDGVERKVTDAHVLDQRLVQRIRAADHWHGRDVPAHVLGDHEDVTTVVDRENEAVQKRLDDEARDRIEDAAERMYYALRRVEHGASVTPGMPGIHSKREKKRG